MEQAVGVHVLAGLPTEAVRVSFERVRHLMPVVPLDGLAAAVAEDATRIGVLLPPFVEPSLIVESWMGCDFLSGRLGRDACVAGVWTFVDLDELDDQLASSVPLSVRGWGRSDFDRRSVADIAVGQIESATRLVLVGSDPVSEPLARCLTVLNPRASRVPFRDGSTLGLAGDDSGLCEGACDSHGGGELGLPAGSVDGEPSPSRYAPVVPPWLEVLQGDDDPSPTSGLVVYRRARPFDPIRLGHWLEDPPKALVRGKGRIWLASEPDQSFGYSCAGAVHRLFPAGQWWASGAEGRWPSCEVERRRLFERWHPRFGDRRQELVFAGVDLDPDGLHASLDECLVCEAAIDDSSYPLGRGAAVPLRPSTRLH